MSIGRIRSGSVVPPTTSTPEAPSGVTVGSTAPFQVGGAQGAEPVAAPTGPLQALQAGVIDRAGYVEAHITQATAHLSMLPPEEQENVRSMLRDACQSDTVLVDLIAKATRGVAG